MLTLLFLGLLAGCIAAPHYPCHSHRCHNHQPFAWQHGDPFAQNEFFDTKQFWSELNNDMRELDDMLRELQTRLPSFRAGQSREGIVGNEYQITIPLSGFDEKDVIVKARDGVLMVQAVHSLERGSERSYLNVKNLPACVNVTGSWVLENEVLKITFPLKNSVVDGGDAPQAPVTEDPVTEGPQLEQTTELLDFNQGQERSREEMDTQNANQQEIVDVDVGVARGDQNTNQETLDNSVEATTYAVDYKNEVDFVPIRY